MRVLILLLVAACASDSPPGAGRAAPRPSPRAAPQRPDSLAADSLAGTFEGYYSAGFEHSGFRPCADTTETWWTRPAMAFHPVGRDQYRAEMAPGADVGAAYRAIAGPDRPVVSGPVVWARLRGRATPRGGRGYGHLGMYTREFAVDSVEAMSAEAPAGPCVRPSSTYPSGPPP